MDTHCSSFYKYKKSTVIYENSNLIRTNMEIWNSFMTQSLPEHGTLWPKIQNLPASGFFLQRCGGLNGMSSILLGLVSCWWPWRGGLVGVFLLEEMCHWRCVLRAYRLATILNSFSFIVACKLRYELSVVPSAVPTYCHASLPGWWWTLTWRSMINPFSKVAFVPGSSLLWQACPSSSVEECGRLWNKCVWTL